MEQKKTISDWKIAIYHFVISGIWAIGGFFFAFVVTKLIFVVGLGIGFPFALFVGSRPGTITSIIFMWLGVRYSANSINKKYLVENPDHIARTATIYWAILIEIVIVLRFLGGGFLFTLKDLNVLIAIAIFYAWSHHCLVGNNKKIPN